MAADQVCEIRRWKNPTAFTNHYLRLDSSKAAGKILNEFVHKVSPGVCDETDWSCTPGRGTDLGGNDQEGEAQTHGETCSLSPAVL